MSRRAFLRYLHAHQDGFLLPAVLSFMIAAMIFAAAVLTVVLNNFFVVGNNITSQQAFNIAEAGVNYYLWHLSHDGTDYQDGTGAPATEGTYGYGPYVHNYIDDNGVTTGTYTLWVKPQGSGSTIVTVRSIGKASGSNITRTVEAQLGATSFASYGVVSDSALWFGSTESANGPVLSNEGVRMDGANSDSVYSANSSYVPSGSMGGDGRSHDGVWCNTSVTTPVNCNTRNKSNWTYPTTSVDFNQVSGSLCTMKKTAFADYSATSALASQSNACSQTPSTRTNAYIPQQSSSFSTTKGYLIVLNSNTYDLYKVTSENDTRSPYTSALGLTSVATGISLPPSGVVFVEDNVWVLNKVGSTFNGRLTIASGRLATNSSTDIVIAGPIQYANKNGTDALGLVAEQSIFVAPYAPASSSGYSGSFNFEVDAALLAESGEVQYGENGDAGNSQYADGYRQSQSTCATGWVNNSQTMTFYGSVATRQLWTWTWDWGNDHCGNTVRATTGSASGDYISGIYNNTTDYDYNLLYDPPPSFPITGGYSILSWREVLTKP